MHCPTCRQPNAATTRFCTSCGAVLVEEAPGGGRRRVLRPWGLRRSAPLTIAPDVFDCNLPLTAKAGGTRVELWLAAGVIVVVTVFAAVHWRRAPAMVPPAGQQAVVAQVADVTLPASTQMHETRMSAPALVDPAATAEAPRPAVVAAAPVPSPAALPRPVGNRGAPAVPVAYVGPARDTVIDDGQSAEPPAPVVAAAPPSPPPAPSDRWQPLRNKLAACEPLALLERAICEQGARLAHCDGHWGIAPLCPAGRTEFGQ